MQRPLANDSPSPITNRVPVAGVNCFALTFKYSKTHTFVYWKLASWCYIAALLANFFLPFLSGRLESCAQLATVWCWPPLKHHQKRPIDLDIGEDNGGASLMQAVIFLLLPASIVSLCANLFETPQDARLLLFHTFLQCESVDLSWLVIPSIFASVNSIKMVHLRRRLSTFAYCLVRQYY